MCRILYRLQGDLENFLPALNCDSHRIVYIVMTLSYVIKLIVLLKIIWFTRSSDDNLMCRFPLKLPLKTDLSSSLPTRHFLFHELPELFTE